MRRGKAVTLAALSLVLAAGQSACDKPSDKPGTPAEMTPAQKAAADSAAALRKLQAPMLTDHDLSSFLKLEPPPADLQEDTIPIRTPEGGPARFGTRSGMLRQQFTGGMTGQRTATWDAYGMLERKQEQYRPVKPMPGVAPEAQNINRLVIATPEYFYVVDSAAKTAYRENNKEDDTYLLNDSMKTMSFYEFINTRLRNADPRLPDTTINGYRLRVFQVNTPQFSLTRWEWRGVTMLEHWRGLAGQPGGPTPPDTLEFYAEPVEMTFNITPPAGTFAPPAGYKVVDGMPPSPMPKMEPPKGGPGAPQAPGAPQPPGGQPPPGMPAPPTPGQSAPAPGQPQQAPPRP